MATSPFLSSLAQPRPASRRPAPTRLDLDGDRAPDGAGVFHKCRDSDVLDASGFELRHVGLAGSQALCQLTLTKPAFLSKRHELLLQLHLAHEFIDVARETRIRPQLRIDPSHESRFLH